MTEVHAAFRVIHKRKHLSIIDEDNGVSVASDIAYVLSALRASTALRPHMKVLLCDAFGLWDIIDLDGKGHSFRGLEAANEAEALRAA